MTALRRRSIRLSAPPATASVFLPIIDRCVGKRPRLRPVPTNRASEPSGPLFRGIRRRARRAASCRGDSGRMDRRRARWTPAAPGTGSDVASHEECRTPHAAAIPRGELAQHPLRSSRVPKNAGFRPRIAEPIPAGSPTPAPLCLEAPLPYLSAMIRRGRALHTATTAMIPVPSNAAAPKAKSVISAGDCFHSMCATLAAATAPTMAR